MFSPKKKFTILEGFRTSVFFNIVHDSDKFWLGRMGLARISECF
uniref:Uncharacterized protein n=1 Tax=Solanum lycopersicum TaxID=4081 RepID=K4CD79_SOLLC